MQSLIHEILESAPQPDRWENTLSAFEKTFDVTSSVMFSLHEFEKLRGNFVWGEFLRKKTPPHIVKALESGDGDQTAYLSLMRLPAQQPYSELTVFNVAKMEDLPPSNIRDFTDGFGIIMRVATVLNLKGPWMDTLFVQTTREGEADRFINDKRTEIIMPIMANSISLGRTLRALNQQYKASLAVLDRLGFGVFLVDYSGCVMETNKEAQRILDLGDGLSLSKDKRLKLNSADNNSELDTMISTANGLMRGEIKKPSSIISVPRPSNSYDYLITVNSLSDAESELEAGLKCAFVTVIDPSRKKPLSSEGLTALGHLTTAESAIVQFLVEGHRPSDIAERRDVSVNTIKSQLKDVSRKLRCKSQSDIIRVAAATRLPLED